MTLLVGREEAQGVSNQTASRGVWGARPAAPVRAHSASFLSVFLSDECCC
jgi:hypothetical protein